MVFPKLHLFDKEVLTLPQILERYVHYRGNVETTSRVAVFGDA